MEDSLRALDEDTQRALRWLSARAPQPFRDMPLSEARRLLEKVNGEIASATAGGVSIEDQMLDLSGRRIRARLYRPAGKDGPQPALLYFHGGAWILGGIESHDALARHLAIHAEAVVISLEYRLAPEFPFPAAVEDCCGALGCLSQRAEGLGLAPDRISVGGDSAGATLAAVVSHETRHGVNPEVRSQVLICPLMTFADDGRFASRLTLGRSGFQPTPEDIEWIKRLYLGPDATLYDPRISPLQDPSLAGLPPTLIVAAELDPLRDEAAAYAQALREAGVRCEYHEFGGTVHDFVVMSRYVRKAEAAFRVIGRFLKGDRPEPVRGGERRANGRER